MPDLPLLSKIKYSEHLQDKEDRKDVKTSSKHRRSGSNSTNELTSSSPKRRQ